MFYQFPSNSTTSVVDDDFDDFDNDSGDSAVLIDLPVVEDDDNESFEERNIISDSPSVPITPTTDDEMKLETTNSDTEIPSESLTTVTDDQENSDTTKTDEDLSNELK